MGYSATAAAFRTIEKLMGEAKGLDHSSGSNCWKDATGRECFYERGREQADGAMVGTVNRETSPGFAKRIGSFRIEPDGKITRFPGMPPAIIQKLNSQKAPAWTF